MKSGKRTTGAHDRSPGLRGFVTTAVRDFMRAPNGVTVIIITVAVVNVIAFYYGSRRFYRANFVTDFSESTIGEFAYWFTAEFVLLFLVPLFLIRFVHKKPFREFGLGMGEHRLGFRITGVFLAIMLPVVWIASGASSFQTVYPHLQTAKTDWSIFAMFEGLFLIYFAGWEFVWRGYMLFGLEKTTGPAVANLVQMVPFVLMHNGKPVLETLGAVIAGLALGALALRTRSFWYCMLTHWLVMFSIDLSCTIRERFAITGLFY